MERIVLGIDKNKNIHSGHRQRMRDRALKNGAESLETHELMEMILYYTNPRLNTNEKAHEILNEYDMSLSLLFNSDPYDFQRRCGINENTAVFFMLVGEILRRYDEARWKPKKIIDSSDLAGGYAKFLLSHEKYECFYAICLDSKSCLLSSVLISEGTISETHVYVRKIIEASLKFNARSIIIAHNHPGGSLVPTSSDVKTTAIVTKALNLIDVFVVDHIIVAGNEYLSMSDKGLIKNIE